MPAPSQSLTGYQAELADPTVQAGLRVLSGSRVSLGVAVAAKLPIADTTSIGTGQWDVGTSASLSVALSSRVTAGLDGSWWRLGDLPDFDFRDPVLGSVSLGALLGSRWGVLAAVSAGTSSLEGYDPPAWVSTAITRLGRRATIGVNFSVGLTETVPDLGLGLSWSLRLRNGPRP